MTSEAKQYCPGCPRRGPFLAMARFGLVVSGDVVCHVNGAVPPQSVIHTCRDLAQGVRADETRPEGGTRQAGGRKGPPGGHRMSEFRGREVKIVADNTLADEGVAAVRAGAESGDGTVTVVFANCTAEIDAVDLYRSAGMEQVVVVDPYIVDEVGEALRLGLRAEGPSVVIAEAPCVVRHEIRKPVYVVDPEVCTGCKHCLKVGCEALKMVEGVDGERKAQIVAADCVGCGICPQLCREDAISQSG